MYSHQTISQLSFKNWLYQESENKLLLFLSIIASLLSFSWIKYLYPFPNFMPPDSWSYIDAAYNNQFINIWAIGYSIFLRIIGFFSHSHVILVVIQFTILQASLLYMLFSIRYFLFPQKWLGRVLFTLCILNPLLPHIANFVSSDCLFTSLSLIWCTQLYWIIRRPTRLTLIMHAFILLLAFMVRFNALYYPIVSISVILLSNMSNGYKFFGIASILVLLLSFIGMTQYEYHKKTRTVQYSAFGGWQLAANALYGYAHSQRDSAIKVPGACQALHRMVNKHLDSIQKLTFRPDQTIGVYYLWDFKAPLRMYMDYKWRKDSTTELFKKWASMAPTYATYGRYLITRHPKAFIKHYILPNSFRYFAPPSLFMGSYNLGQSTVDTIAVLWFGWKNNQLKINTDHRVIRIASAFTIITPMINLLFLTGFISFAALGGWNKCNSLTKKIILYTILMWIANASFSILSAPIELRYQLFPLLLSQTWSIIFIGYIVHLINKEPKTNNITTHKGIQIILNK